MNASWASSSLPLLSFAAFVKSSTVSASTNEANKANVSQCETSTQGKHEVLTLAQVPQRKAQRHDDISIGQSCPITCCLDTFDRFRELLLRRGGEGFRTERDRYGF